MRDTSQITNYDAIIQSGEYSVETKLRLNGVDYSQDKLKSISTSPALFIDVPSVGNCYSAEIDIVMEVPNVTIPTMAEIRPYARLVGTSLTSDWIPQGVFYIDTREQSDENTYNPMLTLHGYDAMLKAEAIYPEDDPSNYPMVDIDVVDVIAETMGIEVDDRTYEIMTDGYEINLPATYTMREVLSYLASMYAGNFCISFEGKLRLVGLTDIGEETNYLIDDDGYSIVFGEDRILV